MKKCFGIIMVAVFAVALMAGGAWAENGGYPCGPSTLDISTAPAPGEACAIYDGDVDAEPSGPYVVGQEWLAAQSIYPPIEVPLGNAKPLPCDGGQDRSNIVYIPYLDVAKYSKIIIKVENGRIVNSANYALFDCEDKVADLTDCVMDGCGCMEMEFTFTFSDAYGDVVPAGTVLAMFSNDDPAYRFNRPTLCFTNEQLTRDTPMTVQVTEAVDGAGNTLSALLTDREVVAKVFAKDQLTARVEYRYDGDCTTLIGPATSTIDVFAELNGISNTRRYFRFEDYPVHDTGKINSVAEIFVIDAGYNGDTFVDGYSWGIVNEGMCLTDSGTSYDLTLNGNQDAIIQWPHGNEGVKLNGALLSEIADKWTINSNFNAHDLRECLQNDLLITVNEVDPIIAADYTVELVVNSPESPTSLVLLSDAAGGPANLAFLWTLNENVMEVRIPHFVINEVGSDLRNVITVTNHADHDAEVWFQIVYTNKGNAADHCCIASQTYDIVLDDCSVTNIFESDVRGYFPELADHPANSYRCGLTLWIAVDKNEADVNLTTANGNWRTIAPVLYKTGNGSDDRQYQ